MKKGDIIALYGRKRPEYKEGYVPTIRGRIEKINNNEVEIYWFYAKRSSTYPIENFEDLGHTKKDPKKGEMNMVSLKQEKK